MKSSGTVIVLFLLAIGGVGLLFYSSYLKAGRLEERLRSSTLVDLASENDNLKKDREKLQGTEKKLGILQANYTNAQLRLEQFDKTLAGQRALNEQIQKNNEDLKAQLDQAREKFQKLEAFIKDLQAQVNEPDPLIAKLQEDLAAAQRKVQALEEEVKREKRARIDTGANAKRDRAILERQIERLKQIIYSYGEVGEQRELRRKELYDGEVLDVDMDRRVAVINLGSVNRVHRGMKFDVIRWRFNRWDKLCTVEVTKAEEATSLVTILEEMPYRLVCPLCGYEGEPNMRHCPYCRRSIQETERSERLVETVDLIREEVGTETPVSITDPVIMGDYITNPFYSKDRKLTFAVAGQPQEYSLEEIKSVIGQYDGQVVPEIDVQTDYLILCQIPSRTGVEKDLEVEEMYNKTIQARDLAMQYGIPIMREVELLDFFGQ
ncbi:MAG: hypothetical protein V1918_03235 [Planctomycetota bacterium]